MKSILFRLFALLPIATVAAVALSGCTPAGKMAAKADDDVDYYTCAMHPSVRSHKADDKCPICSMDLIPVKKRAIDTNAEPSISGPLPVTADKPGEFLVAVDRQQLIGVTYARVVRHSLQSTLRALGTVAVQTHRHWDYVAHVDGYVHDLGVSAPGDPVAKGQVLMDIYSPDLSSTQNEYVDLLKMRDSSEKSGAQSEIDNVRRLIESARARLRQWNVSEEQIAALDTTREAKQFLTLVSPVDGVVEAIPVDQGRHVSVGDHLVDLADLSSVWVWADFYQEDVAVLKVGQRVEISSSSYPGVKFTGTIGLIDPFLNEMKRTVRVRIDVVNSDRKLRPNMYVDVDLMIDSGEALSVPFSAVLPTGQRNVVFVDKGAGRLEPRFVGLGRKYGDQYEVTKGLRENERIVSSANFLIDAESKVQGALKSW